MASRLASVLVTVLCGCAGFSVASAGAATEVGSGCDPDAGGGKVMALHLSRVTAPSAVKTSSPMVVTSWRVQSASWLQPRTMALKVFRSVDDEYEVIAESAPGSVLDQPNNQFPARIPVPAGVLFGVTSSGSIPLCQEAGVTGDTVALFDTAPPVGGKAKVAENRAGTLLPLAVVIEPDADGDGFGDETQDQCPQSAATPGACLAPPPPGGGVGGATVKLKGKPKLEGNVVAVKLTTSVATELTATGLIRGKRAAAPATKLVSPGETGRLYLSLKKSVRQRLATLPRKRKLRMVVEVKATGMPTISAEISLPGRKKPQPARASR